jgi:Bacterial antitoxin of type II TA system, VapB
MGAHMKTTIDLTDALFKEAKRTAAKRGITLRALVEEGLRHVIDQAKPKKPFVLRDVSFRGEGLQPGQREGDWAQIQALIYPDPGEDE